MRNLLPLDPMPSFAPPIAVLIAYLIGSVSFAVIVSRAFGLADPRSYGSGNPGATNVLRSGSRPAAVATLLLDALKGALPVIVAARLGLGEGVVAAVGVAAFAGHLWPVFFRFRGGKGVATAAGVLLALNPWLGLATLASWVIVAAFLRYSSLAAVVAAVFAPFYQVLIWGGGPIAVAALVMGVLLIYRHRLNLERLLRGTEGRLGRKAAPVEPGRRPSPPSGSSTSRE